MLPRTVGYLAVVWLASVLLLLCGGGELALDNFQRDNLRSPFLRCFCRDVGRGYVVVTCGGDIQHSVGAKSGVVREACEFVTVHVSSQCLWR
jgi:hypothetical protein